MEKMVPNFAFNEGIRKKAEQKETFFKKNNTIVTASGGRRDSNPGSHKENQAMPLSYKTLTCLYIYIYIYIERERERERERESEEQETSLFKNKPACVLFQNGTRS